MYDEMIPRNQKYPSLPPAHDRLRIFTPAISRLNATGTSNNEWPGYLGMYFYFAPRHQAWVLYKSAADSTIEVHRHEVPKIINLPGPIFTLDSNPVIVGADRLAWFGLFSFLKLPVDLQCMVFDYCIEDSVVELPWPGVIRDRRRELQPSPPQDFICFFAEKR